MTAPAGAEHHPGRCLSDVWPTVHARWAEFAAAAEREAAAEARAKAAETAAAEMTTLDIIPDFGISMDNRIRTYVHIFSN